jgi:hypothetical protein
LRRNTDESMTAAARAAHKHRPPAGKVSVGFLLNPSEAHELLDLPARWTLRTGVSPQALKFLRRHTGSAAIVSEGLQFPTGSFWVIAYQAATLQHRVFMPLVGTSVRRLIEDARRQGLTLFLEAPDGSGLAARIEVAAEQADAFAASHLDIEQCPELLDCVSAAASVLKRSDGLRPPDGAAYPRDVCLAFILPPELVAEERP